MRPLGIAAIRAGIIPEETLDEFQRWGVMPNPKEHELHPFDDIEQAVMEIQRALDSEEQVRIQTTDLDVLRWYLDKENQIKGRLVIVNELTGERATKTVTFAIAPPADKYIIPWTSDSIVEILTNGQTYLSYKVDGVNHRVHFDEAEDLYFGDLKAFVVCMGREAEQDEQ